MTRHLGASSLCILALLVAGAPVVAVARADDPAASEPALNVPQASSRAQAESPNRSAKDESPSAKQIERWIADLDSEQYLRREHATERLAAAGRGALRPLAQVADGNNLEAASRAIRALLEISESADPVLALSALEQIAGLKNRPADQAAAIAQLDDMRERKAVAELVRLGGVEQPIITGVSSREVNRHLIIGAAWQGGDEGLKHLSSLRSFYRISIHSAPISDEGLKHMQGMKLVGSGYQPKLELFGTKVTEQAAEAFQEDHPEILVDLRSAAKLGVGGDPQLNQAAITFVEPGSAAMEAGILAGDVIVEFEDKPVGDFEQLTTMIAKRQPGETASLVVRRGNETLEKEVTFKRWE